MDTDLIAGIVGALFGALIVGVITADATNSSWKEDAIGRGLALYCPADGVWAWKGDCDAEP